LLISVGLELAVHHLRGGHLPLESLFSSLFGCSDSFSALEAKSLGLLILVERARVFDPRLVPWNHPIFHLLDFHVTLRFLIILNTIIGLSEFLSRVIRSNQGVWSTNLAGRSAVVGAHGALLKPTDAIDEVGGHRRLLFDFLGHVHDTHRDDWCSHHVSERFLHNVDILILNLLMKLIIDFDVCFLLVIL
jgi:hypothetical protein